MQNSKIILMIEHFLPIMLCRFSNDLFALTKFLILHIENLTSKKKKFGYQAINKYSATQLIISCIFEIMNKKLVRWCKFGNKGQNIQILV